MLPLLRRERRVQRDIVISAEQDGKKKNQRIRPAVYKHPDRLAGGLNLRGKAGRRMPQRPEGIFPLAVRDCNALRKALNRLPEKI